MDHNVVVRDRMTEKYLLDELDPEIRDKFEEHYFDCAECARDVSAGYDFVAHSKVVLAEDSEPVAVPANPEPNPSHRGWFWWLRPGMAVPVLAMLLAVIGYQSLVTYPQMRSALKPQVLPWASFNVATWSGNDAHGPNKPAIAVPAGRGFLLFVRIPPDARYTSYMADLYNPSGKLDSSVTIPASADQDQWPVQIPGTNRQAGTYKMSVRGVTAAGESKDLGSTSFELQIQN